MIRICNIALSLALAGSLLACSSSEPEPPPAAQAAGEAAEAPADDVQPDFKDPRALIDACNVELIDPTAIEWDTRWDPAYSRDLSKHPSGVRSAHWANESELASLQQANRAYPVEVSCGSDAGSENSILIEMVAVRSSLEDIPMQTGSYPVVHASAAVKAGEIVVGNLQFNGSRFDARSGNLTIERFDTEGASGNFTIEGTEVGGENRPIRLEGTFNMPCRRDLGQSGCTSSAGERE